MIEITTTALVRDSSKNDIHEQMKEMKNQLLLLSEKVENLKIDLVVIKQEYNIRIGRLYLRIDELDLKILEFNKIKELLKENHSFDDSKDIIKEKFKTRYKTIDNEYRKLDEEEKIVEKRNDMPENEKKELKKLWRSLCRKYHPDLTKNSEEKIKNQEIMKKVNKAYFDWDFEALKQIENEHIDDFDNLSIEILKSKIKDIKLAMIRLKKEYSILKKSEWQIWKNNIEDAKKQGRDLLFELEQKLLQDISTKELILYDYQKQHDSK